MVVVTNENEGTRSRRRVEMDMRIDYVVRKLMRTSGRACCASPIVGDILAKGASRTCYQIIEPQRNGCSEDPLPLHSDRAQAYQIKCKRRQNSHSI
jgi:hypothetical protein